MPSVPVFAAILACANVITSLLIRRALDADASMSATLSLVMVSIATQACLVYLALWLRGVPNRFVPTFAALLACDLTLTVFAGIGLLVFGDPQSLGNQLVSIGYLIWSLAVSGWILHHALNAPFFVGLLLALFMTLFALAMAAQATLI